MKSFLRGLVILSAVMALMQIAFTSKVEARTQGSKSTKESRGGSGSTSRAEPGV
ncbi:MAG: hypothetical protein JST16_03720 [Bdellovibrionales bacterium]|nr:hypothetical protein [Bdellovibrionales bacterium]